MGKIKLTRFKGSVKASKELLNISLRGGIILIESARSRDTNNANDSIQKSHIIYLPKINLHNVNILVIKILILDTHVPKLRKIIIFLFYMRS